jgi:hypothetical protein
MGVGLADPVREGRMLRALLTVARSAATRETKLSALGRLLRRSKERALVFTEYRDTLAHLRATLPLPAALLHGGLTRSERQTALADFSSGRCRVLLATDAASEGLNLQDGCRLVINLELPWNPLRLEQRIGRVDRIGQRRTVHAIHLIGARTGETRILTRLRARIAKAKMEIGAPDLLGRDEELAVAQLVLAGTTDEHTRATPLDNGPDPRVTPDLRDAAVAEVERIASARAVVGRNRGRGNRRSAARGGTSAAFGPTPDFHHRLLGADGPWIGRIPRDARQALGRRVILLWRIGCSNAQGRTVESTLVPVSVHLAALPPVRDRAWVEELLSHIETTVRTTLDGATAAWRADAARAIRKLIATRVTRERTILAVNAATQPHTFQPGLFDRRPERSRFLAAAARAAIEVDRASRLATIERDCGIVSESSELLLVLIP